MLTPNLGGGGGGGVQSQFSGLVHSASQPFINLVCIVRIPGKCIKHVQATLVCCPEVYTSGVARNFRLLGYIHDC